MVMIITRGKLPQNQWYEAHCRNCQTHFRFLGSEAKLHSDQREGDFVSIQCPLPGCEEIANVQAKKGMPRR